MKTNNTSDVVLRFVGALAAVVLMGLASTQAHASIDNPDVDDLAETSVDQEVETQENQQLVSDQQGFKEAATATKGDVERAKAQAKQLHAQNSQLSRDVQRKAAQVEANRKLLAQSQKSLEKTQIEVVNRKKDADRLSREVSTLKERQTQIVSQRETVRTDLANINKENRQLTLEKAKMERDIKTAQLQIKNLKTKKVALASLNRKIKKQHARTAASLRASKTRLARAT